MTIRLASLSAALALAAACSSQSAPVGEGYQKVLETFDTPITSLDVLFVVDNSLSMAGHQRDLVAAARDQLFAQLEAQPGGMPDLHVAITSSSIAVNDNLIGCTPADTSDGRFVLGNQVPNTPPPDCGIAGNFLVDVSDGHGGRTTNFPGTIEDAFACAAVIGDHGCGLEQPLESMHRALDGEHAENGGFLRDDAMLLVVFLSDEDDGSLIDPTIYDPDTSPTPARLFVDNDLAFQYGVVCDPDDDSTGTRADCAPREDSPYIHHIAEYTSFLQGLKLDPSMVMVAAIAPPAAPVNVSFSPTADHLQVDAVCTPPAGPCVDDPTMICTYYDASPAPRLNAFLDAFPARNTLASLCSEPMDARMSQIARTLTNVMASSTCLIGDWHVTTDRCRALDLAPDGGRTAMPVDIVEDDATCGYTATHLRAQLAPVAAGHRVEVDCLK
jgi:hypothetical protein